mmetsp:Transcript_698/g.1286  ORF Transcript_698/g.1286 Transcript_698/m.1286 type:complete len:212 (-) Transcript_698:868-1503(-)
MICPRNPQGLKAAHSLPSHDGVFDRVSESVTQVERTGHVRRRNNNRKRLSLRVLVVCSEEALLLPPRIPRVLNNFGRIGLDVDLVYLLLRTFWLRVEETQRRFLLLLLFLLLQRCLLGRLCLLARFPVTSFRFLLRFRLCFCCLLRQHFGLLRFLLSLLCCLLGLLDGILFLLRSTSTSTSTRSRSRSNNLLFLLLVLLLRNSFSLWGSSK